MFAWRFDTFLLGDEFFDWCAWGCGFQGLVCSGTSISAPLLLGDLLGVDLLGSVRQGCMFENVYFPIPSAPRRVCERGPCYMNKPRFYQCIVIVSAPISERGGMEPRYTACLTDSPTATSSVGKYWGQRNRCIIRVIICASVVYENT